MPGLASWSEVGGGAPPSIGPAHDGAAASTWDEDGPEPDPPGSHHDRRDRPDLDGHPGSGWDQDDPDMPGEPSGDVGRRGAAGAAAGRTAGGRAADGRAADGRAADGRVRRTVHRWLPGPLAGALLDPGRSGAVALVLVVLAAALLAGFGVWSSRPQARPIGELPAVSVGRDRSGPGAATSPAPAAQVGPLVVSVVGKVSRPGLVRVPDGSRVADAVEAAGGALPGVDLSVLNLARRLGDGEQVAIGVKPAPDAQAGGATGGAPAAGAATGAGGGDAGSASGNAGGAAAGGATGAKVNLNQATAEQLDALPGIGPVTAKKILDWRAQNGRFGRVEQLREVDGIGERRFAQLRELVVV